MVLDERCTIVPRLQMKPPVYECKFLISVLLRLETWQAFMTCIMMCWQQVVSSFCYK